VNYSVIVNDLPDSVRVFGAEGGGNPVAGCYPHADMLIDFTILPVTWGNIGAEARENSISVSWSTVQETNTDYFVVERESDESEFETIGRSAAAGNSTTRKTYKFDDLNPKIGVNRYRILQVDRDGSSEYSKIIEASFEGQQSLSWAAVGPVPTSDLIAFSFHNPSGEPLFQVRLIDLNGKVVANKRIAAAQGPNQHTLSMGNLQSGLYFLELKGSNALIRYKVMKN
jgi:hypothetical protein